MFVAGVGATVALRRSMMGAMPMPDAMPAAAMPSAGTMSLAGGVAAGPWTPMPGQGRLGAAAVFLAMWVVMMVAMMMPSLVPMLSRYRRLAPGADARLGARTAVAGAGYFAVWAGIGAAVWVAGVLWLAAEQRWAALARSAPFAAAALLVAAGGVQLTGWKARQLGRCRAPACARAPAPGGRGAWRHGLQAGVACALCCSGFMTILLVAGVMDLRLMAVVAVAITFERLAPWPAFAARAAGVLGVFAGVVALTRAFGVA
ncbi:MAG TPA: DUF2182 domain-containing protein [Gemmatimonadales bacterium]|nr:DUF2182 domain-containing protein [Gemmatimonadales bacterium]